ncbi:MAG: ammonium transporter [Pseudomonadota bacterium]
MKSVLVLSSFISALLTSSATYAADGVNAADTAWIMTSTALVLFMTLPGLALFYGGLVRSKNVLSVLMQCFATAGLASILWLLVGYSLAFSDGGSVQAAVGGLSNVLFAGIVEETVAGNLPESAFAMFQMTFVIITPALIVGGFAERMRFSAVLWFVSLWIVLVYAPITHWVWGGRWLADMGLMDFAGGTVVHVTAGVAALMAAIVLGPRTGFPRTPMPPHNLTMAITGAGMLWVGWFGFNGGSALAANGDAAMAILVTHISAAAGTITWLFYEWKKFGNPTALGAVTGMVAGLGTITPASGFVGPAGALIIGIAAGAICFNAVLFIKQHLKIDDSLDVFPVHGVGGALGTLLAAVFASTGLGVFSGQGYLVAEHSMGTQLGVQLVGVLTTALYTAVVTWVILKIVAAFVRLRVEDDDEVQGLDVTSHGERGYDL